MCLLTTLPGFCLWVFPYLFRKHLVHLWLLCWFCKMFTNVVCWARKLWKNCGEWKRRWGNRRRSAGWEYSCLKRRQRKPISDWDQRKDWTCAFPFFGRTNLSWICWEALKDWPQNLLWQTAAPSVTSSTAARPFFFSQKQNATLGSTLTQRSACSGNSSHQNIYLFVTTMTWTGFHPQSLFEDVFKILDTLSWLLGSKSTESFVFKHPMGTIYQSRWGAHWCSLLFLQLKVRCKWFDLNLFCLIQSRAHWPQRCSVGLAAKWRVRRTPVLFSAELSDWWVPQNHHAGVFWHHFTRPVPTFNGAFLSVRWPCSPQIPTRLMTASWGRSAAWCSAQRKALK